MSTYGELRIIPGFPPYAGPSIFTITYGETHILGVVGNTINFFNDTVRDIEEQLFVLLAEGLEQLFCLPYHFIHKFLGNLGVNFYLYIFLDTEMYPYTPMVYYYDGEPDTIIDDFNELSPLPCGLNEDWLISFGAAPPDADGTKLLGLPSGAAGEDASLPKLLLQYDPLDFEGVPYLENVDGYAYVLFGRDEKDFDGAVYKVDRT